MAEPVVRAVAASAHHGFSKTVQAAIDLVAGEGVRGDAHRGTTVRHRSRVAADPGQPNLRQVHLLPIELFEEVAHRGLGPLGPGDLGENVTTAGIDLLELPRGTRLALGRDAVIEVTGLRNPCAQIEAFRPGLLAAVVDRAADGGIVRRAGIMAVVLTGGVVRAGDRIGIVLPPRPHVALDRV